MKNKEVVIEDLPIVESRRTFLGQCAAAVAGVTIIGCGAAVLQGCEASTSPPNNGGNQNGNDLVLDISSLTADGQAFATTQRGPDGKPILIVRRSATEYLAFSMQCPHEAFQIGTPVNGTITCPLHGSQFDLTGAVKTGPATAPLRRYTSTLDAANNKLTVKLT